MTHVRRDYNGVVYRCDICGKESFWANAWKAWSSIALDETCPADVPTFCSEQCANLGYQRIQNGEWRLPELRLGAGYFTVKRERSGY